MRTWLRDLWHAALLRTNVFAGLCRRPDAFLQGVIVIVVVALLAGLPGFVIDLVGGAGETQSVTEIAEAEEQARQGLDEYLDRLDDLGLSSARQAEARAWAEAGAAVVAQVDTATRELPTMLPRPVGSILRALGGWVSQPLAGSSRLPLSAAVLGTWLGYGVWVMLFAKLLGGQGTLHGFFGATALFAVPHVLDIFARVPYVGSVLGVVALVWGLAVYVKATMVSQELSFERALLAFLLPFLIVLLVGLVLLFGLLVVSVIAAVV